jgi:hypothetical protein
MNNIWLCCIFRLMVVNPLMRFSKMWSPYSWNWTPRFTFVFGLPNSLLPLALCWMIHFDLTVTDWLFFFWFGRQIKEAMWAEHRAIHSSGSLTYSAVSTYWDHPLVVRNWFFSSSRGANSANLSKNFDQNQIFSADLQAGGIHRWYRGIIASFISVT